MKHFGKVLACILAAALFTYLVIFDYAQLKVELSPVRSGATSTMAQTDANENLESTSAQEKAIDTDEATAEDQINQLESELDELYQQREAVQVVLCFEQLSDFLYDDVYPELVEQSYLPMAVFTDAWLPGDNWRISVSEFTELNALGWTFAIGGSSELDSQDAETWQTRLEDYMERIRVRVAAAPSVYCFDQGEYSASYDSILESLGFTAICYYSEDAAADTNESNLSKIVKIPISEEMDYESLVATLKQYSGVVISVLLSQDDEAEDGQISVTQYMSLLNQLETSDDIEIVSFEEAIAAANDTDRLALLEEISAKEAELEQLRAEASE